MAQTKSKKFRLHYFIDKPFQIRYIARFLILILLGLAISIGVLSIARSKRFDQRLYFQVKDVSKMKDVNNAPASQIFDLSKPVNIFELQRNPMIYMSILFLFLITIFGLFISHKMAGPVHRLKKNLKELSKGELDLKEFHFKLRKGDELQELVVALNEFLESIKKK